MTVADPAARVADVAARLRAALNLYADPSPPPDADDEARGSG